MKARPRLIAWAEAGHEAILRDLVEQMKVELVAVGGPTAADVTDLGAAFGTAQGRDLRATLRDVESDLLWLAPGIDPDPADRELIRDRSRPAFCGRPVPGSVSDILTDPDEASTAEFAPLQRRSPGWLAARDVLGNFGEIRAVHGHFLGTPTDGPLLARLFDAMDLLTGVCGEVELIDAALAGRRAGLPDRLSLLRGAMTVNLRFTNRRCGSIVASDAAGAWHRQVTVLGEGGTLMIDDHGFTWTDAGELVDQHKKRRPLTHGRLIGLQIERCLAGHDTGDPPAPTAQLLALCEAARLSCRTGQGESPARTLEMLRRV